jgi:hypothetical protein
MNMFSISSAYLLCVDWCLPQQGIRVLKFFSWEESYAQRVEQLRAEEMDRIRSQGYAHGVMITSVLVTPAFMMMSAYMVLAATAGLEPGIVFAAMSYFGVRGACPQLLVVFTSASLRMHASDFVTEKTPVCVCVCVCATAVTTDMVSYIFHTRSAFR